MAFIRVEYCRVCETTTQHVNGGCSECKERIYKEKVAAWNALTVDERLQDLRRRMEKLEAGPILF